MSKLRCIAILSLLIGGPVGCRAGLGGADYRFDVQWVEAGTKCGPGDWGRRMTVGGRERFYQFHAPPRADAARPAPVVLVFHGGSSYPGAVRYQSGMDDVADRHGFIAVYPAGTHRLFSDRLLNWNDGRPPVSGEAEEMPDDVAFTAAVLDDLGKLCNVDEKRVYAAGISNGGFMAYRLVAELSDRIAAIGPVAAPRAAGEYQPAPPRPVSIIHFHGMQDTYAPYRGGAPERSSFAAEFRPVEETIATWVRHDKATPAQEEPERRGKALRKVRAIGAGNSEVVLWVLEDGGHTWPGGATTKSEKDYNIGAVNKDISASELMWEFFSRHPLGGGG